MTIGEDVIKRILSILAVVLVIAAVFTGCRNENKQKNGSLAFKEDKATMVFTPVRYDLPDGYRLAEESRCAYDENTGNLCCAATRYVREEDGTKSSDSAIFTLSPSGEVLSKVPLPTSYIRLGFFQDDTFWYASHAEGDPNNGFSICCADVETGKMLERIESGNLPQMPAQSNLTVWTIDGDGAFWLAEGGIIRIYSSNLAYLNTIKSPRAFSDLKTDPDGVVWGCANFNGRGPEAARLDRDTGAHTGDRPLDPGARKLDFIENYDVVWGGENDVCGLTEENGKTVARVLLDYIASGIDAQPSDLISGIGIEATNYLQAFDEDSLLFAETRSTEEGLIVTPILYRKTGVTGETVSVEIVLAHAYKLDEKLRSAIVSFNKEHPDIRIKALDYAKYNSDSDPSRGQWMLTNDIVTGVCSPDLIYKPENAIFERELFLDLTPFLEKDDEVNFDNVFASVLRYYTYDDGQIWGIAPFFAMYSVFAPSSTDGIPHDGEGWSVEEYLDFCESLPDGVWPFGGYLTGWDAIFDAVEDTFYDRDNGMISFDSPTFVRLLKLHLAMPTVEEKRNIEILNDAGFRNNRYYFDIKSDAWKSGKIVLKEDQNVRKCLEMIQIFGTRDAVDVGYPGKAGNGAQLNLTYPFAILRSTEHPYAVWEALKGFFHIPEEGWTNSIGGRSVLKSAFDAEMEEKQKEKIVRLENGRSISVSSSDTEEQIEEMIRMQFGKMAYTVEPVYEADIAWMRRMYDTPGDRAIDLLPTAVKDIIFEEVLELEGGVGTAEDCAKKIQSRVSIWLAEHR